MLTKVIPQAKIDHLKKWLDRAEKIVIVAHVAPDGDAIGSSLGLYHYLEEQGKTVNVIVPNAFPDFLRWMPGSKDILRYDKYKEFADELIAGADVLFCLDFNALKRLDKMADAVAASPARKAMIDHHPYPEEFCRITISHPEIASTSELIFRLICRLGDFRVRHTRRFLYDGDSYDCIPAGCPVDCPPDDASAVLYRACEQEAMWALS